MADLHMFSNTLVGVKNRDIIVELIHQESKERGTPVYKLFENVGLNKSMVYIARNSAQGTTALINVVKYAQIVGIDKTIQVFNISYEELSEYLQLYILNYSKLRYAKLRDYSRPKKGNVEKTPERTLTDQDKEYLKRREELEWRNRVIEAGKIAAQHHQEISSLTAKVLTLTQRVVKLEQYKKDTDFKMQQITKENITIAKKLVEFEDRLEVLRLTKKDKRKFF